jgi:hypothetical protein
MYYDNNDTNIVGVPLDPNHPNMGMLVSWLCKIEPLKNDNKNKLMTPSIMLLNTNRGFGWACS